MTRGIKLPVAKKLLVNGFLNEIFENIKANSIKTFLEKSIKEQVDEFNNIKSNFRFLNKKLKENL